MKRNFRSYLFSFLLVCYSLVGFSQQVSVDATLDTSKMRIGEQVKVDLYLNYHANKNIKVQWPSIGDTLTEKVEVISVSPIDTTFPDKTNSTRILQHQQITVSVYDSGYYAIPGFKFIVDNDTAHPLFTQPLFLEVHTVPTDTSYSKTKDIKEPFDEPFNWRWYKEYIYGGIAAIIVIIAVIITLVYVSRRKSTQVQEPPKPKIPPHIIALNTLEKVRDGEIWREGKIKEYYSAISDAVRLYIEERYKVNALESTTDEIMQAFRTQVVDRESKEKLQQMLMLSDLVKFAKQNPIESEHFFTLQNAFDFVNATKREEEVDPAVYEQLNNDKPVGETFVSAKAVSTEVKTAPSPANTPSPDSVSQQQQLENLMSVIEQQNRKRKKVVFLITGVFILITLGVVTLSAVLVYKSMNSYSALNEALNKPVSGNKAIMSMEEIAESENGKCPLMVNSETRIERVELDGNTLIYHFTLVNYIEGQIDIGQVQAQIKGEVLKLVKIAPEFKSLRDNSGSLDYRYSDRNGKMIFVITITPEDYLN